MVATNLDKDWTKFLDPFVKHNLSRPTRLGVFQPDAAGMIDYWIESGLPFRGIDIEHRGDDVRVLIIFQKLTHEIDNVATIGIRLSVNDDDEGIDVTERNGTVTVLRFEA
jgi:hypothetical protein